MSADIHGNLRALLHILDTHGYPPDTRYLFLGDYVYRGPHGVECMCLLLAYKVLFPDAVSPPPTRAPRWLHLRCASHHTLVLDGWRRYLSAIALERLVRI